MNSSFEVSLFLRSQGSDGSEVYNKDL